MLAYKRCCASSVATAAYHVVATRVLGPLFLGEFLRLKAAADMLAERAERSGIKALRQCLGQGMRVEVGGYTLSPELALPLEAAAADS